MKVNDGEVYIILEQSAFFIKPILNNLNALLILKRVAFDKKL